MTSLIKSTSFNLVCLMTLMLPVCLFAQEDSLVTVNLNELEGLVEETVKEELNWVYLIFGTPVALLTLSSIYLWVYQLKKVAEQRIEAKLDTLMNEKLSEKTGVKIETLRSLLQAAAKEIEARQKRILVLSDTLAQKQEMTEFLEKGGFANVLYKTMAELPVDTNGTYLVLVNNEPGNIADEEVEAVFEQLHGQVRLAYFGTDLAREVHRRCQQRNIKCTSSRSYLISNLTDAIIN